MKLSLLTVILLLLTCNYSFSQQQWEPTGGPEGASIGTIVASPDGNVYASTNRGIYRSTNNGESWIELQNSPISNPPNLVSKLAVNKEGDVFALFHNSLYRSLDQGNTWELIFETPVGVLQTIDINSKGEIFIGGPGLYISTDNGDNWNLQNELEINPYNDLEINNEDHLVTRIRDSIVVSSDNGISWISMSEAPGYGGGSIAINSQGDIFIASYDWHVYRTTDDGLSWQFILSTYYPGQVVVNSRDEVFVTYFEGGIRKSIDNGDTWEKIGDPWDDINDGLTYPNVWDIAFDSLDNIYAGTKKGVYRSTDDGESWQTSFNGLNSNLIYSLHTNNKGDIFAVTNSEIYRSVNKGDDWTLIYQVGYDTTITNVQIFPNGDIYIIQDDRECQDCGFNSHVFRSRDNGNTWEDIFIYGEHIECISINEKGEIYIKEFSNLYMSSDDGVTFTIQPNADSYYCNTITSSTGISYKVGRTVIGDYGRSTIDKMTDGITWTPTLILDFPWDVYKMRINSLDHIFLVVKNDYDIGSDTTFMLRSIDEGLTWDTVFIDSIYIHELEFDKYNHLYLATDQGIYYSNNNGNDWNELNEGLEVLEVIDILIDSSGTLYAAPAYAGVWRNMLMVSTKSFDTNSDFSVYPNPSADNITINLPGKMPSNTRLDIFNIQGKLVKSIPVMNSMLTIDISDLVPGPYLVNVTGIKKGQIVIVK